MKIKRIGTEPSRGGPEECFTGAVRIDPMMSKAEPARAQSARVSFEPGARTAWHTHPLGQTLIIVFGAGRVQRWGGPVEDVRSGDVVWFEPGGAECIATSMPRAARPPRVTTAAGPWLASFTGRREH
jgi:quercetin dioxygenase-like cupin family protein